MTQIPDNICPCMFEHEHALCNWDLFLPCSVGVTFLLDQLLNFLTVLMHRMSVQSFVLTSVSCLDTLSFYLDPPTYLCILCLPLKLQNEIIFLTSAFLRCLLKWLEIRSVCPMCNKPICRLQPDPPQAPERPQSLLEVWEENIFSSSTSCCPVNWHLSLKRVPFHCPTDCSFRNSNIFWGRATYIIVKP